MNKTFGEVTTAVILPTGSITVTSKCSAVICNLWKIIPVVLLTFGTFGNIVAISVLLRRKLRALSSNIYLLALTVTDLLILFLGLFRRWMQHSFDLDIRLEMGCGPHVWLLYTSLCCSSWILVGLTVERAISVKYPIYSRNLFSRKTAIIVIVTIVFVSAASHSFSLFGFKKSIRYSDSPPKWNSSFKFVCVRVSHMSFALDVWHWFDLGLTSLMPLLFLIVGNAVIAHELILHKKERGQICTNLYHTKSITKLLLLLSLIFAITTLPARLTICLVPQTSVKWKNNEFRLWWTVANFITYTNNSINFILYCTFGKTFRSEFKSMVKQLSTSIKKTFFPDKADRTSSLRPIRTCTAACQRDDAPVELHHNNQSTL